MPVPILLTRALLERRAQGWTATAGAGDHDLDSDDLEVLEAFFGAASPDEAWELLREPWSAEDLEAVRAAAAPLAALMVASDGPATVELAGANLVLVPPGADPVHVSASRLDGVLGAIVFGEVRPRVTRPDHDTFLARVETLRHQGFLVPAPGTAELGDLRRLTNLCHRYGRTRGTPIDRYYQERFLEEARSSIRGRVVEVGGRTSNREAFGTEEVTEWIALDIEPSPEVTLVADITDPASLAAESVDTVLCFNVLEHIAEPQTAVDTLHRALRPGGVALALVPTVQRFHDPPHDYWRPMPAGLLHLFRAFRTVEPRTYGNVLTAMAALQGLAAEELEPEERDLADPRYPVTSALIARK